MEMQFIIKTVVDTSTF